VWLLRVWLDPSLFNYVVGFWGLWGKLLDHLGLEESTYIVVGFRGHIWVLWEKSIVLSNSFLLLWPTSNMKDLVGMRLSSRVRNVSIMYELPHTTSWLLRGNHENSDPLRSLSFCFVLDVEVIEYKVGRNCLVIIPIDHRTIQWSNCYNVHYIRVFLN